MTRIYFFLFFLFFPFWVMAQTVFQRTYGGAGSEYGRAIIPCSAGGYLVVGSSNSFYDPSTDVYVLRLDEVGDYIWGRNIGADNKIEWGLDVVEDADGNFYIAGYTDNTSSGSYDGMLLKIDSEGNELWMNTYGGDDWDFFYDISINETGEIFCAGEKSVSHKSGWIVKCDAEGNQLWEFILNSSSPSTITGSDIDMDKIAFSGVSTDPLGDINTQIAGLLNSAGNILWFSSYPEMGTINSGKCKYGQNEKLLICGGQNSSEGITNFFRAQIDLSSGQLINFLPIEIGVSGRAYSTDQKPNGNVLVCGTIEDQGYANFDAISNEYNISGEFISSMFTESLGGFEIDILYDIKATPDGGYVAVGETNSFGSNYQVHVVKIDADGNRDEDNQDFIDIATPVIYLEKKQDFSIVPNPAQAQIEINFEALNRGSLKYAIIGLSGQIAAQGRLAQTGNKIDISALPAGLYILSLYGNGEALYSNFIKSP